MKTQIKFFALLMLCSFCSLVFSQIEINPDDINNANKIITDTVSIFAPQYSKIAVAISGIIGAVSTLIFSIWHRKKSIKKLINEGKLTK